MRAAIVAVGSELLSVDRLDTNSLRIAALLEGAGVELVRKAVVGDDEAAIAAEIARSFEDAGLVVVTGGLGPTADDVTREAAARALGRPLAERPEIVAAIERRFASFGRVPSANNRRQALVLDGAAVLENPRGTAPGQRIDSAAGTLFLFPGVPIELELFLERDLAPFLAGSGGGVRRARRMLRVAMRPESEIDSRLEPVYAEFGREAITLLASPGEVRVVALASGTEPEVEARLAAIVASVRERLGADCYGEGEETTLEAAVGAELAARSLSVATAESCTGGLVAARLTSVAGSSRYFPGGVVAYSNLQKTALVGVPSDLLAAHGAVSEPVAWALADGVRERFAADLGVGVTGIAGPDGGSPEKPVGTVHVAVVGPGESRRHRAFRLPGDRERVRRQASQAALELVRRQLLALPPLGP